MKQRRFVVKLLAAFAVFSMLSVIGANAAISDSNAANKATYVNARGIPAPQVQWEQKFGGNANSTGRSVKQTSDDGYIIAGYIQSSIDSSRVYLVKTDSYGKILWQQTFGGNEGSWAKDVQQTVDGGYIIAGYTGSLSQGKMKEYLIKTDSSGSMQWQQTYGGNKFNIGESVKQTTDGGYILVGVTSVDSTGLIYLVKTDMSGKTQWEQTFGATNGVMNAGFSIQQATDGGYIIAGATQPSAVESYVYLVKTDSAGKVQWDKQFGGKGLNIGNSVQLTKDGGYIIGGTTNSTSDDKAHFYLVKTGSSGMMQWQRKFGAGDLDIAYAVQQTQDQGYIIGGVTSSLANNQTNAYLVKTDSSGTMQWQQTFGGSGNSVAYDVGQTTDGGYIFVGKIVAGQAGQSNVYLVKL